MAEGVAEEEIITLDDLSHEQWFSYVEERGWGDGLPTIPPTEEAVAAFTEGWTAQPEPFPPIPPRRVAPTWSSLAANAVMAGCRPEHFALILAALRATMHPDFNLHGILATTHPCTPMVIVNGPLRRALAINCGANCLGQGTRANAVIGRALHLVLTNIGGAQPGIMDRATLGSPAKFTYCFGENEEASPWEPYHVRRGFAASDDVVTVAATEPPHNINDHGSTSGDEIITTIAGTMSEAGSNNVYIRGPHFVVIGPEHAATLHRDGWTVPRIQDELYERSRIHLSRVSAGNRAQFQDHGIEPKNDHYYVGPGPEQIHVLVAGGPGKHSAWIPSFGATAACSERVS
ncbi:MAG: hypothetical protein GEV03_27675 [Streptosporangiales bacterium]|nr:hypothetical protein [Streptosporangiales bacterium]